MKKILTGLIVLLLVGIGIFSYFYVNTDIPKLYLDGDITSMVTKEEKSKVAFRFDDGNRQVAGFAEVKYQGNSSLKHEKKNYTIKLYSDAEHDEKLKLDVGWGPQNKYCLKANWIDRTHARNVVSAKLAGQMQEKYGLFTESPNYGAVDGFPVELYSNGKFYGLYTFNIPKDAWQFGMDEDIPEHIVIGGEGWDDATYFKSLPSFESWEVEVGQDNDETLETMNRLFTFVMNSSDEEFQANFSQYMNLDSALNYYVFCDVAHLRDNLGKNMLLATYDGLEWYPSLYDMDASWGTHWSGSKLYDYENALVKFDASNLFARMEKCFSKELAQRYFELREDVLSNEHILKEFHDFKEQIPAFTFMKEYIRWGSGLLRKPEDLPGYDYGQIEAYLASVSGRLDEKYSSWTN